MGLPSACPQLFFWLNFQPLALLSDTMHLGHGIQEPILKAKAAVLPRKPLPFWSDSIFIFLSLRYSQDWKIYTALAELCLGFGAMSHLHLSSLKVGHGFKSGLGCTLNVQQQLHWTLFGGNKGIIIKFQSKLFLAIKHGHFFLSAPQEN